ncbi:MAG: isopeptide-forming domain-containing fimbrial protein, partial [Anaerolineales bacterium]|nr:isopeptide-forming domain-containing fimbrial protein [Anaerolineales bacterium]
MPECDTGLPGGYNDGPTHATIRFETTILDNFVDDYPSGDRSVDQGDILGNSTSITGNVLATDDFSPTGFDETDRSLATVTIGTGALTKLIYAVNGAAPGDPVQVTPGDNVTYRIRYVMPTGDEENLRFDDYLPLPIFQVGDPDDNGTSGPGDPPPWVFNPSKSTGISDVPSPGEAMLGPNDDFYAYTCLGTGTPVGCLAPTLTSNIGNNSLTFDYGDFDGPDEQQYIVDLLFTVTVNDDPFADRLFLTNQAHAFEGSTNAGESSADAIQQIVLTEPVLLSNKAVIWTSNPNEVYDPVTTGPVIFVGPTNTPRWSGTINSTNLAASPIDSNVSFVDAGDIVTFAIVIENTGSSINGAYDIIIKDTLPAEYEIPGGDPNLQIFYGDGSGPITFNGLGGGPIGRLDETDDLFGNGIELVDPGGVGVCQAHDPTLGNNIILITFDLQIRDNITPGTIINTESLVNYAGSEGGPNHLPEDQTDDAEVTVTPATEKIIVSTEIEHPDNTRSEAVIGEYVTYKITLDIPEGDIPGAQLIDTLDDGLAFEQILSVITSANVSHTAIDLGPAPTNPTIGDANGGTGNLLTFKLGDVDNTNLTDVVETIEIEYRAVVLNVATNQDGDTLSNSAVLSWTGGALSPASAPVITVIEPKLLVSKVPSPSDGDAGDTISFTITVEHDQETIIDLGVSNADAFELSLSDTLPVGLTYIGSGLDCTGGSINPDTCSFAGYTLTEAWTQLTGFPLGSTSVFTFDVTLDASV